MRSAARYERYAIHAQRYVYAGMSARSMRAARWRYRVTATPAASLLISMLAAATITRLPRAFTPAVASFTVCSCQFCRRLMLDTMHYFPPYVAL